MLFIRRKKDTQNWFTSDARFNELYPPYIQALANRHWTPVHIARAAAGFLASENNVRILDIGSGVGKFCLCAAHFKPNALYFGIEQRSHLVDHANNAAVLLGFSQVKFIHGNFTSLSLDAFDHFYFYNPFYENLVDTDKIDESIEYSAGLYRYYNRYFFQELAERPRGTKLATLHSMEDVIPTDFREVGKAFNGLLKCWIKV